MLALAGAAWWLLARAPHEDPTRPPVVAVLPLTNLTGQAGDEAAAAGIAEVVVTSLTQLPEVQVLSRLSTVRYANRKNDMAGVARELDATYLLDGTLQRSQDQVRVSLSLVKAASNVVAWSGTFDGAFPRIFDLQSRVADGVAGALRLSIPPEVRQRIDVRPTASPAAWTSYTDALALLERSDRPGQRRARRVAARDRDRRGPTVRALRTLRWPVRASIRYEETGAASWADRARDESQEALRLDPNDATVRIGLARIYSMRGRTREALDEARTARALLPNSDEGVRLLATILVDAGQPEDALAEARRAVALRPGFAENHTVLGWVHFNAGRFEEAAQGVPVRGGAAARQCRRTAHARHVVARGRRPGRCGASRTVTPSAWRRRPVRGRTSALVHDARGDTEQALHAFEEAARLEPRSPTIRRSLGDTRRKAGDLAGARADWQASAELSRAALEVNPRDPRQLQNLALCLAKLGRTSDALRTAGKASPPPRAARMRTTARRRSMRWPATRRRPSTLLAKAIALGASPTVAAQDDDFSSLRGTQEFETLLSHAASKQDK